MELNWSEIEAPSLDVFEGLAREAFAGLPPEFTKLVGDVTFLVQDFPDDEVVEEMGLQTEFDILGLFQGVNLAGHESGQAHGGQTMVFLYRRPILDYWAEHHETLGAIVRHVLIHEIGHHFGLSDDDMDRIEGD